MLWTGREVWTLATLLTPADVRGLAGVVALFCYSFTSPSPWLAPHTLTQGVNGHFGAGTTCGAAKKLLFVGAIIQNPLFPQSPWGNKFCFFPQIGSSFIRCFIRLQKCSSPPRWWLCGVSAAMFALLLRLLLKHQWENPLPLVPFWVLPAVPTFLMIFFLSGPLLYTGLWLAQMLQSAWCLFSLSCCGQACMCGCAHKREKWCLKFTSIQLHITACKATPQTIYF